MRLRIKASEVRHGDVLIEQRRAVIDHSEWDVAQDSNLTPVVMLVPVGTDHGGWWYTRNAMVEVDRPEHPSWNTLGTHTLGTHLEPLSERFGT